MINNSEFHSPKAFKIFSFSEFHSPIFGIPLLPYSEFHSLIFKYEKKQRKKHLFSEFHSLKEFKIFSFSEFHSPKNSKNTLFGIPLSLKTRAFRNSTPLIFGIPLSYFRNSTPFKTSSIALKQRNKRIS